MITNSQHVHSILLSSHLGNSLNKLDPVKSSEVIIMKPDSHTHTLMATQCVGKRMFSTKSFLSLAVANVEAMNETN